MAPRMVWCCHPVAAAICSTVAPSGRFEQLDHERLLGAGARCGLLGRCSVGWLGRLRLGLTLARLGHGVAFGGLGLTHRAGRLGGLCRRGWRLGLLLCLLTRGATVLRVSSALWRVSDRDRRGLVGVLQLCPEVGRAHAAVEQAGRGGEDIVGGEAKPLGAPADRAQRLALVGRAAWRVIERGQDGRELLLAEVGGAGHGMISFAGEHHRSPTSPSPGGWNRGGGGGRSGRLHACSPSLKAHVGDPLQKLGVMFQACRRRPR